MKIMKDPDIGLISIDSIDAGAVFKYRDLWYIKTTEQDGTSIGVVDLNDGDFCWISNEAKVEKIENAKLMV